MVSPLSRVSMQFSRPWSSKERERSAVLFHVVLWSSFAKSHQVSCETWVRDHRIENRLRLSVDVILL